jgi:cyclic pyranopterin phosphate synthase
VPLHLLSSFPRTFLRHYHAGNRFPKLSPVLSPLRATGKYSQLGDPVIMRMISSTNCLPAKSSPKSPIPPRLTHLTPSGSAHMVDISAKDPTSRSATAVCSLYFSNATAAQLIAANQMKKGDVLSVARIAGIMGAKRTSDLVPLCHPLFITRVQLDVELVPGEVSAGDGVGQENYGRIDIKAVVDCEGKTGVEMEALTAASVASLTVYDMCKAVDKGMRVEGLRVVRKEGGKSGTWVEGKGV